MSDRIRTYVVAVKRGRAADVQSNWVEVVRHVQGVKVASDSRNSRRIFIHATEDGASRIREVLAGGLLVEESIEFTIA